MRDLLALLKEIWHYVRVRRKWAVAIVIVFLVLLSGLLAIAHVPYLAPFIYPLL